MTVLLWTPLVQLAAGIVMCVAWNRYWTPARIRKVLRGEKNPK
jgi:hypothetical protein